MTSRRVTVGVPMLEELGIAPELAALAILEITLATTVNALLLAQPELLARSPHEGELSTTALVARGTIDRCLNLATAIQRYRLALTLESPEDTLLPF